FASIVPATEQALPGPAAMIVFSAEAMEEFLTWEEIASATVSFGPLRLTENACFCCSAWRFFSSLSYSFSPAAISFVVNSAMVLLLFQNAPQPRWPRGSLRYL